MYENGKIWAASAGDKHVSILPKMANRHGLVAGATGTGKTVTLKVLAESFSDCGVPVFLADAKGDLAGMCEPGVETEDMRRRIEAFGLKETSFCFRGYPVCFWDVYGKTGIPLRTTVSEMGPTLLARLMDLNSGQSDILRIVFKIADDEGLLLLDSKDLRAMLQHVYENSKEYSARYGNLAKQSLGAITRAVTALEAEGGEQFFGEPALDIRDWFSTDINGRGTVNLLDCRNLVHSPVLYSTFLLWMLSELFEVLPEVGDLEKPRMVFFFDEAHLLFDHAPRALLQKIEQVVRLIRSKGVGVYFVTQNPSDIPGEVLSQLGNKILHGLHAYTPAEIKKAKAAAQSFRANPEFDTYEALMNLGTAEALVSFLDEEGRPSMAEKVKILPPQSKLGAVDDEKRRSLINQNALSLRYGQAVDRDSAYEFFERRLRAEAEEGQLEAQKEEAAKQKTKEEREAEKQKKQQAAALGRVARTTSGTIGREIGNELGKKVGGSFGKRLGGNIGAALGRGLMDTLFRR